MKLPKTKTENIVVQNLEKEILIYELLQNKAYCLNETSAIVYRHCDGKTNLADLKSRFKMTDDLIFYALDELSRLELLDDSHAYQSPLAGLSRREVIRRVGLASMIALPVVSALIAPDAARAASGFAAGSRTLRQTCNSSTDCASSASNCTNTPLNSGQQICCVGDVSYYDTNGVVNSCSGGSCNSATFTCQSDAGRFCCSGSATATCNGNNCACRCT